MIVLDEPWHVATPIGDARCLVFNPGSHDETSLFFCVIEATGEFWWFRQPEVRLNTNLTDGRTRLTPFSAETMKRFAPMRDAADRLRRQG